MGLSLLFLTHEIDAKVSRIFSHDIKVIDLALGTAHHLLGLLHWRRLVKHEERPKAQ